MPRHYTSLLWRTPISTAILFSKYKRGKNVLAASFQFWDDMTKEYFTNTFKTSGKVLVTNFNDQVSDTQEKILAF